MSDEDSRSSGVFDVSTVVTLSEFNDRWNKMALGIVSDSDVPSRPEHASGGKEHSPRNDSSGSVRERSERR